MNNAADLLMILLVLANQLLLGLSRLGTCIRVVAVQGIAIGVLPLLINAGAIELHVALFSAVTIGLKGIVFPLVLMRTLRDVKAQREVEPFIGYGSSIALGTVALIISIWLSSRLPLPTAAVSSLIIPASLFTMLSGLLVIISRKKALTQVLGYLVLENGIYALGVALVHKQPLLVELGILLDVFVAVFVMGIAIFHINREFDHIDTDKLSGLRT
jgi:hydrogenase-4 component E